VLAALSKGARFANMVSDVLRQVQNAGAVRPFGRGKNGTHGIPAKRDRALRRTMEIIRAGSRQRIAASGNYADRCHRRRNFTSAYIMANASNMPSKPTSPAGLEIWLIRHGETAWSRTGQHTGRTDIPLTEHGQEQARALVPILAAQRFDRVLSSPLVRATETCRLAGLSDRLEIAPDAQEWDYGIYEGRTTHEIRAEQPDWSIWQDPMPKGENLAAIQARAMGLMHELLSSSASADAVDKGANVSAGASQSGGTRNALRIALFSHGHFLRVFGGCWVGDNAFLGAHLLLDTASVSVLGFDRETRAIKHWNRPAQ